MPPLSPGEAIAVIAVVAAVTLLTRAAPFLIFAGGKTPPGTVSYIGRTLPPAVIAVLIIYCIKDIAFTHVEEVIPAALSIAAVALIHWKWRNTLLSVGAGTILYMILVQLVFV